MWNTASIAETLHHATEYGFALNGLPAFDWPMIKKKRDAYILRLNGIYESNLAKDKIDHITGFASFVDSSTISVNGLQFTAPHILIATGSKAWIPSFTGNEWATTSDGFFELESLPQKVQKPFILFLFNR